MRNIRDLKYLVSLADLNSFSKAAEACFVSQPTLSAQLKKLEEELGVTLFERSNKHVLITSIGKIIADKARAILQQCDDLKQLALNAKDIYAGTFRLGIIPTLGPYLLPKILTPLKKQLPTLELIVHENKTSDIITQLKAGDLDAIILALPISKEGLVIKELFHEPFILALPKEHPLNSQKEISLRDLKSEKLLLLSEGHCFRDQALEACNTTFMPQHKDFQATSLETLRELVIANFGITLLPELSTRSSKENKRFTLRNLAHPTPSRSIGIAWRAEYAREKCCEKIMMIIQEEIKKLSLTPKKHLKIMKKVL